MSEKKIKILFLLVWLPLVVGAYLTMVLYSATPTYMPAVAKGAVLPMGVFGKEQELHVFLHPQCVCSMATLAQVRKIRERSSADAFKVVLHFLLPEQAPENFAQGNLMEEAKKLSKVQVVVEKTSPMAKRHKVLVSGQALFFDSTGNLRFNGGLTPERGCEGDSTGVDAVLALVRQRQPENAAAPVYGCRINNCPRVINSEPGYENEGSAGQQ
jgi:hypothetical protein